MSTRCEIVVKTLFGSAKLYHHHDGYIEGVGFDLYKRFWANDGIMVTDRYIDIDYVINELVKDDNDEYQITIGKHTDIEYYYEIDVDRKTLTGYMASYECNKNGDLYLKKYESYDLEKIKEMYEE